MRIIPITFTASANGKSITNYQWEYRIKKNDGNYELIKNADASTFTISPLSALSSQYARNSDGSIIGEVNLSGTVDGNTQRAAFNLYMDCAPDDIYFSTHIIRVSEEVYNVEVTLSSKGADRLSVETTNWETGIALVRNFDLQYLKLTTLNLAYGSEIEYVFRASNSYGYMGNAYNMPKISYRFTNPPSKHIDGVPLDAALYAVYTVSGFYVKMVQSPSEITDLQSGAYIIQAKDAKGNTLQTEKIMIK
jgi:hypothetical protein